MLFILSKIFLYLYLSVGVISLSCLFYSIYSIIIFSFLIFVIIIVAICESVFLLCILSAVLNRKIEICQILYIETLILSVCFEKLIINTFLLVCTLLILKEIVASSENIYSRVLKLITC